MAAEERRQVQDHADDGGGDRGQRRDVGDVVARRLDQRPAGEHEHERRQEREPGDDAGRGEAGEPGAVGTEQRLDVAADEADEGDRP